MNDNEAVLNHSCHYINSFIFKLTTTLRFIYKTVTI